MLSVQLDPLATALLSLTAISSFLLAFVLLGSRWFDNYLYAFVAQSWTIAALAAVVGYFSRDPELYLVVALTGLFRGLVLPYLIWRMIERVHAARELHEVVRPATGLVVGALAVIFAFAVSHGIASQLGVGSPLIILALTVTLATMLIGFLMLVVRQEAVSQVIALLVLENGIRIGALILIPEMPLLIELMILFDVLVVVACFGVLVRYLQTHAGTTSARELRRLVG
jgi:hydrogenase-4 component E